MLPAHFSTWIDPEASLCIMSTENFSGCSIGLCKFQSATTMTYYRNFSAQKLYRILWIFLFFLIASYFIRVLQFFRCNKSEYDINFLSLKIHFLIVIILYYYIFVLLSKYKVE